MKVTNQQMLDWIKETLSQRRLILSSERREGTRRQQCLIIYL